MELVRLDPQLYIGQTVTIAVDRQEYVGTVVLSSRDAFNVYIRFNSGGWGGNRAVLEHIDESKSWDIYMSDVVGYTSNGGWPEVRSLDDLQKCLDRLKADYGVGVRYG